MSGETTKETMVTEDQNDQEKPPQIDPVKEAVIFKTKGNKEYSAKNYSNSIELYSHAISLDPKAPYYGNRAAALICLYKYEDALKDCLKAIELDKQYTKAYIRGVKCYLQLGNIEKSQELVENGIKLFSKNNELKKLKQKIDVIKLKIERIDDKLYKIADKYNSLFSIQLKGVKNSSLYDYASKKNINESKINDNENEIKNDDNNDNNNNNNKNDDDNIKSIKLTKNDEKDINIALNMISDLLTNDMSKSLNLKCKEIECLLTLQKYDESLSKSTNLLRFNNGNYNIIKLRAISLFKFGNVESAIQHMKKLLQLDPDNKECRKLFKLFKQILKLKDDGNNAFKNKEYDNAIKLYTECIKMDLTNYLLNSKLFANRAAVYLKKKNFNKAYDDCLKAIHGDENYSKAYVRASQACIELEKFDEAVGFAEKACKIEPNSHEWKNNLKKCQMELKKSKRKNYYKILNVPKSATEKEITKGFRKMAAKWHPDRFASGTDDDKKKAESKFKEIGEAYEILKDPKMKKRYDAGYDIDELKNGRSHFNGTNIDISHIFEMFNQQGGFGGMGGGSQGFTFRMG